MKETGIIMSGDHPKLILDGVKTMTRRVIKPQPDIVDEIFNQPILHWKPNQDTIYLKDLVKYCPYGQIGDRLWVREIHKLVATDDGWQVIYKAGNTRQLANVVVDAFTDASWFFERGTWRPSIHMPRWASRILLEITELHVERLQEIKGNNRDLLNEGFVGLDGLAFIRVWNSLNAKRGYGWDINPWVWVIGFKKL